MLTTVMLPPTYDLVWSVIALGHVVLLFAALRAWFRDTPPGLAGVVAAILIVVVPLLGPLAYLVARRDLKRASPRPASDTPAP